jgi:transcriptional regulator with XRE-family HTH domain
VAHCETKLEPAADCRWPVTSQAAERMGMDSAHISGLELGGRNPAMVTIWHLAEALWVKFRMFGDKDGSGSLALVWSFLGTNLGTDTK